MTSIAPRQDRFCFCGNPASPEPHHILHKSMGGEDIQHNLLDICPGCHAKMHPEKFGGKGIKVAENSEDVLRIVDARTGEVEYEAWKQPEWWPQRRTEMLAALASSDKAIIIAARTYFKYLEPLETEEVYDHLKELDRSLWEATARLLMYAQLRMPYHTRTERFAELVQSLGIQKSLGYKYVAAVKELDKNPELFHRDGKLPPPDAILLTVKTDDPVAAIELYTDREAQNPRYSIAQFRQDLQQGNSSVDPEPEYCKCPTCGKIHLREP